MENCVSPSSACEQHAHSCLLHHTSFTLAYPKSLAAVNYFCPHVPPSFKKVASKDTPTRQKIGSSLRHRNSFLVALEASYSLIPTGID